MAPQPAKAKVRPAHAGAHGAQPVLIFAPPQGSYTERLHPGHGTTRAKGTPEAISEVVAALGVEDKRIRWLAGSVLQSIGGETVIATLRAFVRQAETEVPREQAEKVLGKLVTEELRTRERAARAL